MTRDLPIYIETCILDVSHGLIGLNIDSRFDGKQVKAHYLFQFYRDKDWEDFPILNIHHKYPHKIISAHYKTEPMLGYQQLMSWLEHTLVGERSLDKILYEAAIEEAIRIMPTVGVERYLKEISEL